VYDLRGIYGFVGVVAAVNLLIGVMWFINEAVTSGDAEERESKKANFKKAGIYFALVILGAVLHPGRRQFPQVLEFRWSFVFTGFLICAIAFLIAALRATGIRRTRICGCATEGSGECKTRSNFRNPGATRERGSGHAAGGLESIYRGEPQLRSVAMG
jgi:hypothetical protein